MDKRQTRNMPEADILSAQEVMEAAIVGKRVEELKKALEAVRQSVATLSILQKKGQLFITNESGKRETSGHLRGILTRSSETLGVLKKSAAISTRQELHELIVYTELDVDGLISRLVSQSLARRTASHQARPDGTYQIIRPPKRIVG